nr:MAG TPA: hypothetical protein [Caudoviricetes sp.]
MLPDFLVKPLGTVSTFVKANSPVILTVTSVVGVISTAVLAAKATPTALDLIADEKRDQLRSEEPLTGMQSTWGYAKRVLPVVGDVIETTAFSILSIFKRTCFNQSCLYILAFSFFSLSVVEKLLSKSSSIDIPIDGISFLASTNKALE